MTLIIPDNILQASQMTEQEIQLELALLLYQKSKISSGMVRTWTGLSVLEFQRELAKRNLYLNYDVEDFEQDLQTLKSMGTL